MELSGKAAIVTGGAMGIGLAVTQALSGEGAQVVSRLRRHPAVRRSLVGMSEEERAAVPQLVPAETIASDVLGLLRDDSIAGPVLVRFAERQPYLLDERAAD